MQSDKHSSETRQWRCPLLEVEDSLRGSQARMCRRYDCCFQRLWSWTGLEVVRRSSAVFSYNRGGTKAAARYAVNTQPSIPSR